MAFFLLMIAMFLNIIYLDVISVHHTTDPVHYHRALYAGFHLLLGHNAFGEMCIKTVYSKRHSDILSHIMHTVKLTVRRMFISEFLYGCF